MGRLPLALLQDGDTLAIQSRAGQPLGRYFPEMVEALLALAPRKFVLDGEIVVPSGDAYSFEELQLRIHPAESRVKKLAAEIPGVLMVFDLLVDEKGESLMGLPCGERRARLEDFARCFQGRVQLCRATRDRSVIPDWERELRGKGIDGLIAKRTDARYSPGDRKAMQKFKWIRTADCVVGGFRYASTEQVVGSLLLGLHDDDDRAPPPRGLLLEHEEARPQGAHAQARGHEEGPRLLGARAGRAFAVGHGAHRGVGARRARARLRGRVPATSRAGASGTGASSWSRRDDKKPEQCTFDQLVVRRSPRASRRTG